MRTKVRILGLCALQSKDLMIKKNRYWRTAMSYTISTCLEEVRDEHYGDRLVFSKFVLVKKYYTVSCLPMEVNV